MRPSGRIGVCRRAYLMIPLRQKNLGVPSKLVDHFGDREVPVREVADFAGARGLERSFEFASNGVRSHWLKKAEDWLEKSESKD